MSIGQYQLLLLLFPLGAAVTTANVETTTTMTTHAKPSVYAGRAMAFQPALLQQSQRRRGRRHPALIEPCDSSSPLNTRKCGRHGTPSRTLLRLAKHSAATDSAFPYASALRPGRVSPQRIVVDESIVKPEYWMSGRPKPRSPLIDVKSSEQIANMRAAGALARHVLDVGGRAIRAGVTTDEIDAIVHHEIVSNGAYPSTLNYHGYSKSCCTSVNEVICHGIPDDRPLVVGDIINLDVTVYVNGYHGDCSEMYVVRDDPFKDDDSIDDIDPATRQLLQTTYDCWISACQFVLPGRRYQDIGAIIEDYATAHDFTTVSRFVGHGIGATFHAKPDILHYRNSVPNGKMAAGHTFTIEPMICEANPTH